MMTHTEAPTARGVNAVSWTSATQTLSLLFESAAPIDDIEVVDVDSGNRPFATSTISLAPLATLPA